MNGVICIYKEKGYTSFDIVAIMRRFCGTKKIGHGGTLDPMAEGVLPIFVGTATKAVDYCPDNTKEYRAEMRFGVTTDTQDFTGKILATDYTPVSANMQYLLKKKFPAILCRHRLCTAQCRWTGRDCMSLPARVSRSSVSREL